AVVGAAQVDRGRPRLAGRRRGVAATVAGGEVGIVAHGLVASLLALGQQLLDGQLGRLLAVERLLDEVVGTGQQRPTAVLVIVTVGGPHDPAGPPPAGKRDDTSEQVEDDSETDRATLAP